MAEPTIFQEHNYEPLAGQTITDEKGNKFKVVKAGSTALGIGDIVVYTGTDGIAVSTTTSASSTLVAGIMMDAVAANGYGRCMVYGIHTAAKVDGGTTNVTTALLVGTSGVAGYAYTTTTVGAVAGVVPASITTKSTAGTVFVNVI